MSTQLLIAALVAGSVYALIALGLNLVYGTMRLINVAHGEVVMIGAYVAYWGISLLSVGPLISAIAAMPIAMALGAVIYFGIFRRAMRSPEFMERIEGNSLLYFSGSRSSCRIWRHCCSRLISAATGIRTRLFISSALPSL